MREARPGLLSVRAVNQYRRRDVLPYLSLRYYLGASASRTDSWAANVATDLTRRRTELPYVRVNHFKEITDSGQIRQRQLYLPGANESLAEAALLAACSEHTAFRNPSCVYSYELNSGTDRSGVYVPYIFGLRKRHDAIAGACDACPNGVVRYTDIRQFYPSISASLAAVGWRDTAERAGLPAEFRELGGKLLADHAAMGAEVGHDILTGPMFSHLLGNLVLRELDEHCSNSLPARYFRYVDDITLVGTPAEVRHSTADIRARLADLGFELHDDDSPKSLEVATSEWLTSRSDFHDAKREVSWMSLVGDIKRFLLANPEQRDELQTEFRENELRLPLMDYSHAIYEGSFVERVLELGKERWLRRKVQAITVESLLDKAKLLRSRYQAEFIELVKELEVANEFQRKRRIPKSRYRAGRLIYLAKEESLTELSATARAVPELRFHEHVMHAVGSGDIDMVLALGSNAAQAAAQPLRAAHKQAWRTKGVLSDEEVQALGVLLFNGVGVKAPKDSSRTHSQLLDIAERGGSEDNMTKGGMFARELACLHGVGDRPRHSEVLETAFDKDEEIALDAIEQLQQSVSP